MDELRRRVAREAVGFMPESEGLALHEAGLRAGRVGPLLEIGSYCGRSAVYLGDAAEATGSLLFALDHHRGSEEHQPGEAHHDRRLTDAGGRVDTLPEFRRTIARAKLEPVVVALVGWSALVAVEWRTPLALLLIDGGHSEAAAAADYASWAPRLRAGGLLCLHDVFADPADGGQAPFHVYRRALAAGYRELAHEGSLRVLEKSGRRAAAVQSVGGEQHRR